jgi:hypothetical protein
MHSRKWTRGGGGGGGRGTEPSCEGICAETSQNNHYKKNYNDVTPFSI